jgi:hypothetical protein
MLATQVSRSVEEIILHKPPITNGRKYQVLFLSSWNEWSNVDMPKRTINRTAAAKDGS